MRSQTARTCCSVAWDCITTNIRAPGTGLEKSEVYLSGDLGANV